MSDNLEIERANSVITLTELIGAGANLELVIAFRWKRVDGVKYVIKNPESDNLMIVDGEYMTPRQVIVPKNL